MKLIELLITLVLFNEFGLLLLLSARVGYNKETIKLPRFANNKFRSFKSDDSVDEDQVTVSMSGDDAPVKRTSYPLKRHVRHKKLQKLFWKYPLDKKWLSITQPSPMNGKLNGGETNDTDELERTANYLNFTITDRSGTLLEMPVKIQEKLKSWLVSFSTCEVYFKWEDLGQLFWPRYIRRPHCKTDKSCSWPNGMSCKLTHRRDVHLLNWICDADQNGMLRKRHTKFIDKLKRRKRNRARRSRVRRRLRKNRSLSASMHKKRSIRIIHELSRPVHEALCHWKMTEHGFDDQCKCGCN